VYDLINDEIALKKIIFPYEKRLNCKLAFVELRSFHQIITEHRWNCSFFEIAKLAQEKHGRLTHFFLKSSNNSALGKVFNIDFYLSVHNTYNFEIILNRIACFIHYLMLN